MDRYFVGRPGVDAIAGVAMSTTDIFVPATAFVVMVATFASMILIQIPPDYVLSRHFGLSN